jgi:hypothetical protein
MAIEKFEETRRLARSLQDDEPTDSQPTSEQVLARSDKPLIS